MSAVGSMPMAVVLAGGRGTRLRPITDTVPKPMVTVLGRPFLEHLLALLHREGVRDVLLLIGYLGYRISEHFGDGRALGLSIRYSGERESLGTAGALRNAADHLRDQDFMLLNGDTFVPMRYRDAADRFRRAEASMLMAVLENDPPLVDVPCNVAVNGSGRVVAYAKGVRDRALRHVDAGVAFLRPDVLERIPEGRPASLEEDVYPSLAREGRIVAFVTSHRFYDIGTLDRLKEFEQFLLRARASGGGDPP